MTGRSPACAHAPGTDRFLLPLPGFAEHADIGVVNVATG